MTDLDTTPPVVMALLSRHPAGRGGPGATAPDHLEPTEADQPDETDDAADAGGPTTGIDDATVLPLNDAATVYEALAAQITGTAVGWSDDALAKLEQGLLQRYGPAVGGRQPIRRLVRLAARPPS